MDLRLLGLLVFASLLIVTASARRRKRPIISKSRRYWGGGDPLDDAAQVSVSLFAAVSGSMKRATHDVLGKHGADPQAQADAIKKLEITTQLSIPGDILAKAAKDILDKANLDSAKHIKVLEALQSPLAKNGVKLKPDDSLRWTPGTCPWPKYECDPNALYRSFDGSCNNLKYPLWGRAFTPLRRSLPAHYTDGISTLRRSHDNSKLPSPRYVSRIIDTREDIPDIAHTGALVFQGQLLAHDLSLSPFMTTNTGDEVKCGADDCQLTHEACAPIEVTKDDPDFSDRPCLPFVRSETAPNMDCKFGPREQINTLTAFIDGSEVYGSCEKRNKELRDPDTSRGRMKVSPHPYGLKDLLPTTTDDKECTAMDSKQTCYKAGDVRANEQPILTILQTIHMRWHNKIEAELYKRHPDWSGEKLFQESRKISIATLQHITYNEFLPLVLGKDIMKKHQIHLDSYDGYDTKVDPSIANSVGAAAFRFGHSMLPDDLEPLGKDYQPVSRKLFFSELFFRPKFILTNPDSYIRGIVSTHPQTTDNHFVLSICRNLFTIKPPHGAHMDLVSLNIQRGRDHGLPGYQKWREWCGLEVINLFMRMKDMPRSTRKKMRTAYKYTDDIDLYIGGVSETPVPGGVVGPTFACILGRQFKRLRLGDRFWYERECPQGFTKDQLAEIRKVTFSYILCQQCDDLGSIQPHSFEKVTSQYHWRAHRGARRRKNRRRYPYGEPDMEKENKLVPCSEIPAIDFSHW